MAMRDKYGLDPDVFHTDKDFAEISARKLVWPDCVHQICAWHRDRAVGERLSKNKLSTVVYNPAEVIKHYGHDFVDPGFLPRTQRPNLKNTGDDAWDDGPDEDEPEPEPDAVPTKRDQEPTPTNPNAMSIPLSQLQRRLEVSQGGGDWRGGDSDVDELADGTDADDDDDDALHPLRRESAPTIFAPSGLKIKIPAVGDRKNARGVKTGAASAGGGAGASAVGYSDTNGGDEEESACASKKRKPRRIFCPRDLHEKIKMMMTAHQDAHPLIPGYANPTADGIRWWAAKQMYLFCERHDLPEVWAYMWGCWYCPGRWELWARSAGPTVPRLKTTMICESQYVESLATEVEEETNP
jgi:hypothetical protein